MTKTTTAETTTTNATTTKTTRVKVNMIFLVSVLSSTHFETLHDLLYVGIFREGVRDFK